MPTGGLPALAVAGGGPIGDAGTATGVLIGPGTGPFGTAGNAMMQTDKEEGGSSQTEIAKESADDTLKETSAAEQAAHEVASKQPELKFSRPQLNTRSSMPLTLASRAT
jgi:hypothetical protein